MSSWMNGSWEILFWLFVVPPQFQHQKDVLILYNLYEGSMILLICGPALGSEIKPRVYGGAHHLLYWYMLYFILSVKMIKNQN